MSKKTILTALVDKFIQTSAESDADELIKYVKASNISAEETAYLALKLGTSGQTVKYKTKSKIADIASTGGPSSLSTLLCPLYLNRAGYNVISLGVPGRPAGGVDVLAQIPGYSIELSKNEIISCLKTCGYVHFLANENYAPLDALLFKIRQKSFAQDIPALVTASLLSKKIAVGVNVLGLDVRVSPNGNFGKTWNDAKRNAMFFCEVAQLLEIKTKCFLTDARFPYQPYIGRGESLLALYKLFIGAPNERLKLHSKMCFEMASLISFDFNQSNYNEEVFDVFKANLVAQKGDYEEFKRKAAEVEKAHSENIIKSDTSGILNVDLGKIRTTLVDLQKKNSAKGLLFSDPAGIILKKNIGEFVEKGETLASFRCDGGVQNQLKSSLTDAFSLTAKPLVSRKMEVVENA